MLNIYTPAEIERITDATIGRPELIAQEDDTRRAALLERRAAFVANVGEQVAREVAALCGSSKPKVLVFAGDGLCGAYALESASELHAR